MLRQSVKTLIHFMNPSPSKLMDRHHPGVEGRGEVEGGGGGGEDKDQLLPLASATVTL